MKTNRGHVLALATSIVVALGGTLASARAEDKPSAFPQKRPPVNANDLVRRAQKKLKEQGYYSGKEDGLLRSETQAAIRHYQLDNGLRADGRLTGDTAQTLKLVMLAISPRRARIP